MLKAGNRAGARQAFQTAAILCDSDNDGAAVDEARRLMKVAAKSVDEASPPEDTTTPALPRVADEPNFSRDFRIEAGPSDGIGLEAAPPPARIAPAEESSMLRPLTAIPALLLTAAIGAAAPACASSRYYQRSSNQRDYRDIERFATTTGTARDFPTASATRRDRRGYRIDRDREDRNADSRYRYGDRGDYRRSQRL